MLKTITKNYVLSNRGCYDREQANNLSFMAKDEFSIFDLVNSEMPLKDKFWFIIRKCDLTDDQKREVAIGVAEITLVIFENKYPNDKRPREAVQAAKDYLAGSISIDQLRVKRDAAYAAAADAAAYAAAYAAYAAAAYADAAYAAADADADADADAYKKTLLKFLIDFIDNN